MDERDDELELEIVDLDERDDEAYERDSSYSFAPEGEIVTSGQPDEEGVFAPSSRRNVVPTPTKYRLDVPRFTTSQRHVQLVVTIGVVVALLLLLINSYKPIQNRVIRTLTPPSPLSTAPLGPNSDLFYFNVSPPWGQFSIDNRVVTHIPDITGGSPLRLTHGRHRVRWVAEPFSPQECTVSVPFSVPTDTCHANKFLPSLHGKSAWIFNASLSLAQLPRSSFTTLVSNVGQAFDAQAPTETVLPGELYAANTSNVQGQAIQHAKEPLRATLRYQLDSENTLDGICSTLVEVSTPCTFDGQQCYLFCTVFPGASAALCPVVSWSVLSAVQATWEYTTMQGNTVAASQPEMLGTSTVYDHLLPLCITWDGVRWTVTLPPSQAIYAIPANRQPPLDVSCNTALNMVREVLVPSSTEQAHSGIAWQYVSSNSSAIGCLSIATLNQGLGSMSPPVAYCLHRFGVMLAANDIAHHYWPSLPVADVYEQQLAQQLAKAYQHPQDNV